MKDCCPNTHIYISALPLHLSVVAIEKGPFGSPLTTVTNLYIYRSKRVRTPVTLLHSLSGKYPWEKYEPHLFPPAMGK